MVLADISSAFVLGLLTPLTAVCVLPLYPGFLSYLSNKISGERENRKYLAKFGVLISLGVILFMFLLGLVFTTILEVSLTNVIGIVSPIAFGILLLISIFLLFDVDASKFIPKARAPVLKNPTLSALVFGFFFGAIVVPCNPAFIAILFTKSLIMKNFIVNMLSFVFFGAGLAAPLLLFSLISLGKSQSIISWLTGHKSAINRTAGAIMLLISLYYLIFVFRIFG